MNSSRFLKWITLETKFCNTVMKSVKIPIISQNLFVFRNLRCSNWFYFIIFIRHRLLDKGFVYRMPLSTHFSHLHPLFYYDRYNAINPPSGRYCVVRLDLTYLVYMKNFVHIYNLGYYQLKVQPFYCIHLRFTTNSTKYLQADLL